MAMSNGAAPRSRILPVRLVDVLRSWPGRLACAALTALVLLCASEARAAGEQKVAVIDLRRAVTDTEDGLRVQSRLKQLFDSRQQELDEKQKAFQVSREALDKDAKAGKVSKTELQKRYETLQQTAMELEKLASEYQREMQRQESQLTTPIVERVNALIRREASQNGYDFVLDRAAVPFYRSDLDITDRIIQFYNAGEGQVAPPTTPPAKGQTPKGTPAAPPKAPPPAPAKKK
jgi:outer membrane protein